MSLYGQSFDKALAQGALGTVVASTVTDLSEPENPASTREEQRAQLEQASNRAKLIAGVTGLFTGQNVGVSIRADTNMLLYSPFLK